MIEPQNEGREVWAIASLVEKGDRLTVEYRSSRGKHRRLEMSGRITKVKSDRIERELFIQFRRDDGQECRAKDDGWLYSIGSNFSRTGTIVSLDLVKPKKLEWQEDTKEQQTRQNPFSRGPNT